MFHNFYINTKIIYVKQLTKRINLLKNTGFFDKNIQKSREFIWKSKLLIFRYIFQFRRLYVEFRRVHCHPPPTVGL